MALTSSSTYTDAIGQYNDNLLWDNSATKASLALEAVRWLLANRAQMSVREGMTLSYADLSAEKKKLESFIESTTTSKRATWTHGFMKTD